MLTRRALLVGALAAGLILRPRTSRATASQPATPLTFEVPARACDCHTHIHGDPARFPFLRGAPTPRSRRYRKRWRRCIKRSTSSAWSLSPPASTDR